MTKKTISYRKAAEVIAAIRFMFSSGMAGKIDKNMLTFISALDKAIEALTQIDAEKSANAEVNE